MIAACRRGNGEEPPPPRAQKGREGQRRRDERGASDLTPTTKAEDDGARDRGGQTDASGGT